MTNTEILATVGGQNITRADLEALIKALPPQTAAQFNSPEGIKRLLDEVIQQELIYLDAVENGLDKEPSYLEEVERVKSGILKQYALNELLKSVTVTKEEVKDYYEANKESFVSGGEIKASHILVNELAEAFEIKSAIEEGQSFEDAAKQYSNCPSGEAGGDLGYFSRGMMVPEFDQAAFSLDVGVLSEPVKTQFGYHLIQVTDKKASGMKEFDEVRDKIASELMTKKQHDAFDAKIAELKGKYEIKKTM